jgi:hypothetical protein
MTTVDVVDDISAIIRVIERIPVLVLMGCILIFSLILQD